MTGQEGVVTVPLMHKEGEVYVIVIKQWRPAFGTYCLELPAGEFGNPLVCLLTMNVFFSI